ncbi:cobalt-precorrin-3B C(17)-methyltransferase [Candidatus Magnetoovum chiemensis]|nr:cobalt-precorrin-3B C(17)-methyltransferase [Candidatus Magnetoovum chiemensis]
MEDRKGKLYVVGTGPGSIDYITVAARAAIEESDVVVGFNTYVSLIKEILGNKEIITTSMTQEKDRCETAINKALEGKTVSLVCGGDPGVYALAGLVLELVKSYNEKGNICDSLKIEIIPGVPALCSCAALLGAPLMHDFASISLSDRLTPWELIEKRLHTASSADFVICLYNPKSKGRKDHLTRALNIIKAYRKHETPVGIVKSAVRENEQIIITSLDNIPVDDVDMHSTVIIGNSTTFTYDKWIVTPRGYKLIDNK